MPKEETSAASLLEPSEGDIATTGDAARPGWNKVQMDNGTFQWWRLPPRDFDPHARSKTLSKLDKAYVLCKPTPEAPEREAPTRLLVNKAWRDLFPHQMVWDEVLIEVCEDGRRLPGSGPQFKFVYD